MNNVVKGFIVATVLSVGIAGSASAQESAATPTIPTAADCIIEPIAFERLASLSATPVADAPVVAEASPAAVGMPAGEPADEVTTAAVQAVVTELIACINAGDTLRTLALYSDPFIYRGFGGLSITQEMYDAESTNLQPRAAGQEVALVEFGDAVVLEDGRVAILVRGDDFQTPGAASGTIFHLVEIDSQWLIDETAEMTDDAS